MNCHSNCCKLHRDAFCQSTFRWIHYQDSNKSTGLKAGKLHVCAMVRLNDSSKLVKGLNLSKSEKVKVVLLLPLFTSSSKRLAPVLPSRSEKLSRNPLDVT